MEIMLKLWIWKLWPNFRKKIFFRPRTTFYKLLYTHLIIIIKNFFIGWLTNNEMLHIRSDGIYKTDYVICLYQFVRKTSKQSGCKCTWHFFHIYIVVLLHCWHLLLALFFSSIIIAYCNDIEILMEYLDVNYTSSYLCLFIDSSKSSLKAAMMYKNNLLPTLPIAYANVKEDRYPLE